MRVKLEGSESTADLERGLGTPLLNRQAMLGKREVQSIGPAWCPSLQNRHRVCPVRGAHAIELTGLRHGAQIEGVKPPERAACAAQLGRIATRQGDPPPQ